ncbi:MAG: 5-oxoprolinase subunit PxpB [Acidisphaera sp.]|nr:5-oxoprolinase subunit PxpB [Acidisphaera sp.]
MTLPRFLAAGDTALLVEFGDAIDPAVNAAVIALDRALAAAEPFGILETVPTYRSLLVQYDPRTIGHAALVRRLGDLLAAGVTDSPDRGRHFTVPVVYGAEFGEDLADIARSSGLTPEAVIAAHLAAEYQVYMIGFAPGFAYLGGLPEVLHLPRRENPRARIPGGSVIIGGMQAAISATPIPSGWHVLGRTPLAGFDPARQDPFLFQPGDRLRFRRIEQPEFAALAARPAVGGPVASLDT